MNIFGWPALWPPAGGIITPGPPADLPPDPPAGGISASKSPSRGKIQYELLLELESCNLECELCPSTHKHILVDLSPTPSREHHYSRSPSWGKFQTQLLLELESSNLACDFEYPTKTKSKILWVYYKIEKIFQNDKPCKHNLPTYWKIKSECLSHFSRAHLSCRIFWSS